MSLVKLPSGQWEYLRSVFGVEMKGVLLRGLFLRSTCLHDSPQEENKSSQELPSKEQWGVCNHILVHDGVRPRPLSCPISTGKGRGNACQIAPVSQPPSLYGWNASAPGPASGVKHFLRSPP
jgi:hypothetical protein